MSISSQKKDYALGRLDVDCLGHDLYPALRSGDQQLHKEREKKNIYICIFWKDSIKYAMVE